MLFNNFQDFNPVLELKRSAGVDVRDFSCQAFGLLAEFDFGYGFESD